MRMVKVDWIDSMGGPSWEQLHNRVPTPPGLCETVGWLIHEAEDFVEVALSRANYENDSVGQVHHVITIPKIAITSMVDVKTDGKKH